MTKLILLFGILAAGAVHAQSLTVKFSNVRNNKGVFRVGFFENEDSYKSGDPVFYKTVEKNSVKNHELTFTFDSIPNGTYGLVVLDDENANDKTDYSWFIPNEGFGFSNYVVNKIEIPSFNNFKFNFISERSSISVCIKYLSDGKEL